MMLRGSTDRRADELRNLARDLLIVRSTTIGSGDGSLFDPSTDAARVLNDGALSCLRSAEEMQRLGRRFRASRRSLVAELSLGLFLIGVIFAGSVAWNDTPPSPAETQWMRMSEHRLSAIDATSKPATREVGNGER